MPHYVAIIEDAGPDQAVGVWFPDLPGCISAGDDIDEALRNAPEDLELYAESLEGDGKALPRPRTLTELKADPKSRTISELTRLPWSNFLRGPTRPNRIFFICADCGTGFLFLSGL